MTAADWQVCTNPKTMLTFLRGRARQRKLRLFLCACYRVGLLAASTDKGCQRVVEVAEHYADGDATKTDLSDANQIIRDVRGVDVFAWIPFWACCRNVWHLLKQVESQYAVEVAERFADGLAGLEELEDARQSVLVVQEQARLPRHGFPYKSPQWLGSYHESQAIQLAADVARPWLGGTLWWSYDARDEIVTALRDVFGNPFRPATLDSALLTWHDETIAKLAQAIYDTRDFDRLPILADALEEGGCMDSDILSHCRSEGPHARGCWLLDLLLKE